VSARSGANSPSVHFFPLLRVRLVTVMAKVTRASAHFFQDFFASSAFALIASSSSFA
jgi:hypothetical protein